MPLFLFYTDLYKGLLNKKILNRKMHSMNVFPQDARTTVCTTLICAYCAIRETLQNVHTTVRIVPRSPYSIFFIILPYGNRVHHPAQECCLKLFPVRISIKKRFFSRRKSGKRVFLPCRPLEKNPDWA